VKSSWKHYDGNLDDYVCSQFTRSLKLVKDKVVFWAGKRYKARDRQLNDVEQILDRSFKENVEGLLNAEVLNSIKLLESKKCKLLLDREND